MNISIIGSGNIAKALGVSAVRAGHQVVIASRNNDSAAATASEINATAAESLADAVAAADVVIFAVPATAAFDVAREIAPVIAHEVVIDVTNPLKGDMSGLFTEGTSIAEELAGILGDAKLVKGFNTLFGSVQANPQTHGTTLDALFAIDDDTARETFATLAMSLGFRPVHVGPLAAARELESMALLNIRLQIVSNGYWQSSFVLVGAPESSTATPVLAKAA
ncbi:MAG TPA: NAD(P)-binding domain-containing protein [Candidatus Limnocylindrales bacterium]|nr:NAD(P)-binding domain-containing protein [Candidatus Limnocylindrales bacterium]